MKISEKRQIIRLLRDNDAETVSNKLRTLPPSQVINPLFAGLSNGDEKIRWQAITAMGPVAANLADSDMEAGRVVMRRLMWSLNDESGGIGWGAPEAMAEIMTCHAGLAEEYAHILVSYMREDGNFLELPALQRGLMWGIGRMAQTRSALMCRYHTSRYLLPYLDATDPTVRGIGAWAMGFLGEKNAIDKLKKLSGDHTEIRHFLNHELLTITIGKLAKEALTETANAKI